MAPAARPRRHDPERRDRIVDACLDVIAEHGVAGCSHRRVAAAADVPLGSMTYHFDGMQQLLTEAFGRFADSVAEQFERRLGSAAGPDEAAAAVAALITEDVFDSRRSLVLTPELYTLAAREPAYRSITRDWMSRSRAALERHVDATTARLLDALIEGLTIHRALDTEPGAGSADAALVEEAVRRVLTPAAP